MGNAVDRARAAALRLLAGRELTASEVGERLARKGFEREAIDTALARLISDGLLDDRRAAMVRARHSAGVRGRGPARVLAELRHAGIAAGIAREVVEEVFSGVDRAALIDRAIERRLAAAGKEPVAAFRRLHARLVRLGFSSGEAYDALRRRLAPPGEDAAQGE
ncbi:MAG: regulatory protein RecX [Vicinamibacterales bacterium]